MGAEGAGRTPTVLRPEELADLLASGVLDLPAGTGMAVVQLDAGATTTAGRPLGLRPPLGAVVVGVADSPVRDVPADLFDVLLVPGTDAPRPWVGTADVAATVDQVAAAIRSAPAAAIALVQVLRATEHVGVAEALTVESMAYSMLQHGEAFQAWLAGRRRHRRVPGGEPVALRRDGHRLDVVLQRVEVHNALDAAMRESLWAAFDVVASDPTITEVHLRGAGPSFCSGGDLDEFGTATDAGAAHLVRTARSVGWRVHQHAERITAHLHGACIGAGIEIPAFAGRVVADPATGFRLPEVGLGLVPGAGGTASLPRRIGRHRTAYLALTGVTADAATALAWGLIDAIGTEDGHR